MDYGDSFNQTLDEEGIVALRVRLADKWNRFKQLSKGSNPLVKDESLIDTMEDMANYLIMGIMWLEEQEEKAINKAPKMQEILARKEYAQKHVKAINMPPKELWEYVTSTSWNVAHEEGLTDGTERQNLQLKKDLLIDPLPQYLHKYIQDNV